MKIIIQKRELYYLKPKQVISTLRDRKDIPLRYIPTKQQIGASRYSWRRNLVSSEVKENYDSLKQFTEAHCLAKTDSDDELICLDADLNPKGFLLTMTTKALLENMIQQNESLEENFLHTDATFKLLRNGFCLLILGTENSNHNFCMIACAITAHEDGNSYQRFF